MSIRTAIATLLSFSPFVVGLVLDTGHVPVYSYLLLMSFFVSIAAFFYLHENISFRVLKLCCLMGLAFPMLGALFTGYLLVAKALHEHAT